MHKAISRTFKPARLSNLFINKFSTSCSRRVQFYNDAEDAVQDIPDGAFILNGGFGVCGVAENCIRALRKLGTKNLTMADITSGIAGTGGMTLLIDNHQVKRLITTYIGLNPESIQQYLKGELEVDFTPQGNLVERIRAGGAGIPAFFTPTGFGTLLETGGIPVKFKPNGEVAIYSKPREVRQYNGRSYLLEEAITGDYALVKAWKADRSGNLIFRKSARNINPAIAKAAKVTIAEVEEIVETGEIDPDHVHVPHIYVDRVFKGKAFEKKFGYLKLFSTGSEKAKTEGDLKRERIAKRAVLELKDGMHVNLGLGLPCLLSTVLKPGLKVHFQAECGILGLGPYPKPEELDLDLVNAATESTTVVKGASFFSSDDTFGMIRGGHLDWTVLGAMQVSKFGDLANWTAGGNMIKGMGGAMDLASAPRTKVMVTMEHTEKNGTPKIVDGCSLPLTGRKVVSMLITDMGVFDVSPEKGLTLLEIAENVTLDKLKASTGCDFTVSDSLKPMAQANFN